MSKITSKINTLDPEGLYNLESYGELGYIYSNSKIENLKSTEYPYVNLWLRSHEHYKSFMYNTELQELAEKLQQIVTLGGNLVEDTD